MKTQRQLVSGSAAFVLYLVMGVIDSLASTVMRNSRTISANRFVNELSIIELNTLIRTTAKMGDCDLDYM